jgi:hypothetical protein
VQAKYLWSVMLFMVAAPMASAQTNPFGPFSATAHGTVSARRLPSGAATTIEVQLAVRRTTSGGNVSDIDAQGGVVVHDLGFGTIVTKLDISLAVLHYDMLGNLEFLELSVPAKVHETVSGTQYLASFTILLVPGGSPNFSISSPELSYVLTAPLATVEIQSQ